jgi:hypothetical protein
MDNNADEIHPEIQLEDIEQGDALEATSSHLLNRSRFRVDLKEEALAAMLPRPLSYFEWSIVTYPMEIDGDRGNESGDSEAIIEGVLGAEENGDPESMDNEDEKDDQIDNLKESSSNLDDKETPQILLDCTNIRLPVPLEGYEYMTFNPTPINWNSPATTAYKPHPTQPDVLAAMENLKKILHPRCDTGQGYNDPEIYLWRRAQLEGMMSMFHMFTNPQSHTYNQWCASECQTAIGMGRGTHCTRRLCDLNRAYLADEKVLPINPYGDWNESLLVNEDLVNEIGIYLLSLGNDITAKKLMDFLHRMYTKESMELNVTLAIRQCANIFKLWVITTNLLQRVSMLMDMKGRMLLLIGSKFSFQNGKKSWIGWLCGIRI